MKILGIESSCDETAAAVVEDGQRLLSNVVHSQIDIHAHYGGVIPEIAARSHIEAINPVINQALTDANCTWDDIDAIAVTYAPGLVGSLLVGSLAARTLAIIYNKPLYGIHHVEAHVYANFITSEGSDSAISSSAHPQTKSSETASRPTSIEYASVADGAADVSEDLSESSLVSGRATESTNSTKHLQPEKFNGAYPKNFLREAVEENFVDEGANESNHTHYPTSQPTFPMLALIVSGGHTQLVLFQDHGDYRLLGHTQDDAVGEAFDKVAKIIGLPYPGGPSIAAAAPHGDARAFSLPKARMANPYDFSFSGLKTAVLRAVQAKVGKDFTFPSHELPALLDEQTRADVAASFQRVAIETLVDKTLAAYHEFNPTSVVIAGGVAANAELRRQLADRLPIAIQYAPMNLCTDNAAMIATLGYFTAQSHDPVDPYSLEVVPSLSMVQ